MIALAQCTGVQPLRVADMTVDCLREMCAPGLNIHSYRPDLSAGYTKLTSFSYSFSLSADRASVWSLRGHMWKPECSLMVTEDKHTPANRNLQKNNP